MANDFSGNPWIIDTVMPAVYPHAVFIKELVWTEAGDAAGSDSLVIKRKNGSIIVDTKNSGVDVYQRFGQIGHVEGFQVTTLAGAAPGKVHVFIK